MTDRSLIDQYNADAKQSQTVGDLRDCEARLAAANRVIAEQSAALAEAHRALRLFLFCDEGAETPDSYQDAVELALVVLAKIEGVKNE